MHLPDISNLIEFIPNLVENYLKIYVFRYTYISKCIKIYLLIEFDIYVIQLRNISKRNTDISI